MPSCDIDRLMQRYTGAVPGASVLVVSDGVDVVRRGYGLADLESPVEAGPATNYRLASLSKQFTAAAVLLLVQDGRLKLDDPVRRWLPTLPAAAQAVTLHHLLSHTSGLVDYEDLDKATDCSGGGAAQLRDRDVLRLLQGAAEGYFASGTAYRYSNGGYALLALVVERASDADFPDFLRERVFRPLGMYDSLAHAAGGPAVAHRAWGYREQGGRWQRADQDRTSAVLGDGGIYSSIDDLARWDAALHDDRLLSDTSRHLAFAPATAIGDPAVRYGLGWRISGDCLWHSGESIGFRNVILRWPQRRLSVIVLSNRDDPEPYRTALAIARPLLKR